MTPFTHLNAEGRPRMVDVAGKPATSRQAVARSALRMTPETLAAVRDGALTKGDVFGPAQVAGILAAKRTGEWIPMCHTLPLSGADLHFRLNEALSQIEIEARVQAFAPTGVEMEALTAATVAALTLYDMIKASDPTMVIGPTWLVSKTGGKRGVFRHFRAQVTALSGREGATRLLVLEGQSQVQLMPEGAEPNPDQPVAWLNTLDLEALVPGACLEAGPLRLEVLYAREAGWLAEVNDGGVLRPGDTLEAVG
ncbi:MAG: cyclic pyranopterin monophosphate synthase MoaC [Candidatus Sericytochromatia bacterium]|nr:cyclic pyranopterin monophosphate synthase MoaC [Candidatus Sericytochromatia bacterium]